MKTPIDFKPFAYQKEIINHICKQPRSLVFVGAGLGKSVSTLYAFDFLKRKNKVKAMLVVAPLRVMRLSWPNDIKKWAFSANYRVADLRTKAGKEAYQNHAADIYLINYEQLQKLDNIDAFDMVVFDESTKAKNDTSKRINAFRKKFPHIPRRVALTGTPACQGYLDVFAQVRLIDDGDALGRTMYHFKQRFFDSDFMGYNYTIKVGAEKVIEDLIKPITISMKASEYMDIPDTIVNDIDVTMPAAAVSQYKELRKEFLVAVKDSEVIAPSAGVLVNKLLQITGGAVYAFEDDETKEGRHVVPVHDAKIKALKKLAKEVKRPLLIAVAFNHEKDRILDAIEGAELWRDDILSDWQAGKVRALVFHPAQIGHGVDGLQHGGTDIVWYSMTYSLELYLQTNARLARIGQDANTFIHRLIVKDSVDEAIVEALRNKDDVQAAFLESMKRL